MKKITKYSVSDREELQAVYQHLAQNDFDILTKRQGHSDAVEDNQDARRRFSLSGMDKLIGWKYRQEVAQTKQPVGILNEERHKLFGSPLILAVTPDSRLERVLDEYISAKDRDVENFEGQNNGISK